MRRLLLHLVALLTLALPSHAWRPATPPDDLGGVATPIFETSAGGFDVADWNALAPGGCFRPNAVNTPNWLCTEPSSQYLSTVHTVASLRCHHDLSAGENMRLQVATVSSGGVLTVHGDHTFNGSASAITSETLSGPWTATPAGGFTAWAVKLFSKTGTGAQHGVCFLAFQP